jgi:pheromone shutdown protein TraB
MRLSETYHSRLHKRLMAFVVALAALLIFLNAIGFGFPNPTLRLIFILWMIFLIAMALAAWHWWGRGIFKPRPP